MPAGVINILNKYSYELKANKSTRTKQVYFIKSADKNRTQNDVEKQLAKSKISYYRKKDSGLSGSTEVTVIEYPKESVVLVFKPAGGMSQTTLNSTITELSPALAFENNYKPKSVDDFYAFLKTVNHKKSSVYVIDRDRIAGQNFVNDFPTSPRFKEKMENAIGVLDYLQKENKTNKIKNVYWGYRAKPKYKNKPISDKHKGDLFIEYQSGTMIGVSLKAGGETTSEPKLNTYVNKVLEELNEKMIDSLRKELYKKIYSKFSSNEKEYDKGSERRQLIEKLASLEKNDVNQYNKLYDIGLDIIRKYLIEVFEHNFKKTLSYFNQAIVGKNEEVPLVVVKAYGKSYKLLTDEDDLGSFIPKVRKLNSYFSKTSKQDFFVDLVGSKMTDKLTLKFSVRTNKAGDEHKLGQFYNLAVKFNGIK